MQNFIIDIMNTFGYFGIMFLIALENIFPPIPSEVILTFGGFITKRENSNLSIVGVIFFATVGSIIGALVLYYIGKILNKERLKKIVSGKVGKVLFLKPRDIDKADRWFDTKGNKAVFFCRMIPVVRSLISIPAGMSEMPMGKFLLYTITGSLIWNSALVIVGSLVGESWESVVLIIDRYAKIIVIILVVVFVILAFLFYFKRRKKQ